MNESPHEAGARLGAWTAGHAVVTMLGLGHRLGLLEPLSAQGLTVDGLAAQTGTDSRYVREWLATMVAAGVVAVTEGRFGLREAYRPLLAGARASNIAPTLEMMVRLAEAVPEVAARFGDGRGIPASTYAARAGGTLGDPRRHLYRESFVDGFLAAVPGLHERLRRGAEVLDLGCGTGQTARLVAEAFPACRVLGVDVVEDVIARARREHAEVPGLAFAVGDAGEQHGHFDVVLAVDVIHDLPEPERALRAIRESVTGGLFVMIDTSFSAEITDHVDDPVAASAGAVSVLYCLPVSLQPDDSPLADSGDGAGAGLGALWGYQRAEAMLRAAGFTDVDRYRAPRPQNAVYVASG